MNDKKRLLKQIRVLSFTVYEAALYLDGHPQDKCALAYYRKKKDMQKRKEIIENAQPSLVVSVHLNKYALSSRRGAQVFYNENSKNGKVLAESVQQAFNELSESKREYSPLKGDYYILNCTNYPSIIAECGFLSNPEEEALLITDEYQDDISYTIFKGIVSYLSKVS